MEKLTLKIPATSANLGPGLDCLAIALTLYNQFEIKLNDTMAVQYTGLQEANVLDLEQNLVIQTYHSLCQQKNWPAPNFNLNCKADIPMAGGLGSSATAILAGVVIARCLNSKSLKPECILEDALKVENHPDNLCAALHGGFTTAFLGDENHTAVVLPTKINYPLCCWVLYPQDRAVKTEESRQQLPNQFSMQEMLYSLSRACTLTAAFCNGRLEFLFDAMRDKLHEPWRMDPAMEYPKLKNAMQSKEFYGWSISGSGPSVMIFCKSVTLHLEQAVKQHFKAKGVQFCDYQLKVDNQGLLLNQQPVCG